MNWKSGLPDRTVAGVSRPDQGTDAYFPPPAYGYGGMAANDPRTSSSQSLVPSLPEYEEVARRTLLVVYIHGFMGNDTSFQSFPAHVHRYLRDALAETHVIHSKIYPRYKTYKALEVARDNFSRWLEPHESANTDVVLVGHSMGGLLAAEVALMPTGNSRGPRFFQHRILGTVHLDVPLLGLHPGIVVSGISSLFRPKPDGPTPQESPAGSSRMAAGAPSPEASSLYSDPSSPGMAPAPYSPALPHAVTLDPNFNPEFPNDVRLQDRGWWKNVVHFVKKHNAEGLVDAATSHIMSHLEFGGVLMEFNSLKVRYENLRKLEEVDDIKNHGAPQVPPQIRFIQYYTVCHGFPKKPKTPSQEKPTDASASSAALHDGGNSQLSLSAGSTGGPPEQGREKRSSALPNVPSEDPLIPGGCDGSRSASSLELVDPEPIRDEDDGQGGAVRDSKEPPALPPRQTSQAAEPTTAEAQAGADKEKSVNMDVEQNPNLQPQTSSDDGPTQEEADLFEANLPAVPDLPDKPAPFEPEKFTDKDSRKQAEKEAKRAQKAYDQAVKNREKTLKERQKIVEKRKKKAALEAEKREKEEQKRQKAEQKAEKKAEQEKRQKGEEDGTGLEVGEVEKALERAVEAQNSLADAGAAAAPTPAPEPSPAPMDPDTAAASAPAGEANKKTAEKAQKSAKPPKERKFINLPSKVNGQIDPKWVKIFMKDTDEVGAHTGLFFPGPHYEKLVGDVGDVILSWVHDDATKKTILGLP